MWQSWIFTTNSNRRHLFFISSHSTMKSASIWMKNNTVFQSKLSTFSLVEKWPWFSLFLSQLNHFLLHSSVDAWIDWCSSWEDFFVEILLLSHKFHSNEQCICRPKSPISTKNDLSIWKCIICLKFTRIGRFLHFHWTLQHQTIAPWCLWQSLFPSCSSSSSLWDLFLQDWVWGWHVKVKIHHLLWQFDSVSWIHDNTCSSWDIQWIPFHLKLCFYYPPGWTFGLSICLMNTLLYHWSSTRLITDVFICLQWQNTEIGKSSVFKNWGVLAPQWVLTFFQSFSMMTTVGPMLRVDVLLIARLQYNR